MEKYSPSPLTETIIDSLEEAIKSLEKKPGQVEKQMRLKDLLLKMKQDHLDVRLSGQKY